MRRATDPVDYALAWGSITAAEVAEGLGLPASPPPAGLLRRLDAATADGTLVREGPVYRIPEHTQIHSRNALPGPATLS